LTSPSQTTDATSQHERSRTTLTLLGPIAVPVLRRWWLVLPLALLISASIEIAQFRIPDRSADVDDVIVNVAGALLGYLAFVFARFALRSRAAAA
jgi:glycopeptide antibiotics resistance protein